jgi:peptidoglycan/LPS O-acetylase OafA/YrhL
MNKDGGLSHKLHGLDHLRAFAIIFVFLYHYGILFPHPGWVNNIGKFGWSGVDLFFVLSGYLIASQLFKNIAQQKNVAVKEFFIKRFFRIIPIYLVVVALYFLFPFLRERESPAPLWKYLTFTQNIGLDVSKQGTFSHAWSLCIEEQFYLLLPFILVALMHFKILKKGYWILVVLFIAGIIIRSISYRNFVGDMDWLNWYKWIYYPTWTRLDGLLVGVSIAALLQFKPNVSYRILKYGNWLLLISLVIFAFTYFFCSAEESFSAAVFGFPLVDIAYGFIVLSALSSKSFLYKYESKVTAKIAGLSYGIYLIHKIVIHVTQTQLTKFDLQDTGNAMFFICIGTVLIASIILNEVIEKPFLRLRKRILRSKKTELSKATEAVIV